MADDDEEEDESARPLVSLAFTGNEPESLARVLFRDCHEYFCSYGHAKRALAKGQVFVDGERANAGTAIHPGQQIGFRASHEVRALVDAQGTLHRRVVYFERLQVLVEDDHCAIVVKPPGLLMDAATATTWKGSKASLRTLASILPFVLQPSRSHDALLVPAAAHRLDAPVGGLVTVAKTKAAARALHQLFSQRHVMKTYIAIVAGKSPEPPVGVVSSPIDGKLARTSYRVLSVQPSVRFSACILIELSRLKGRRR